MLYTRAGDSGTTKAFGCDQRMSKSSAVAEALGTLDELNSYLGLVRADTRERTVHTVPVGSRMRAIERVVHEVQEVLFTIQAEVAGAPKKVGSVKVKNLETITDRIENIVPPIHSFSLAGGTYQSALFDVARTIARRAERRVVAVHDEGAQKVGPHTLAYLNRLSSLLFALARYANHCGEVREEAPTYR